MPPKIRQLIKELKREGFIARSGKGSHRIFKHPLGFIVVLSGKTGADAKAYQIHEVRSSIKSVKYEKK
jgi:predicted RNA binding protein YcfA (HicA-like mRNA interferase family)